VRGLKLQLLFIEKSSHFVAPRRGAWIETVWNNLGFPDLVVAPRRGAWIETGKPCVPYPIPSSHPAGVRGLKLPSKSLLVHQTQSHPAGVRGLKHIAVYDDDGERVVAPRRGAWIETGLRQWLLTDRSSRTPQGCVD